MWGGDQEEGPDQEEEPDENNEEEEDHEDEYDWYEDGLTLNYIRASPNAESSNATGVSVHGILVAPAGVFVNKTRQREHRASTPSTPAPRARLR